MSSDSGQKFIKRNRPPRVQISYEDPYDAQKKVELPFVMGVMSDLSGNASQVEKPSVADRKFSDVDMDNVEAYMKSVAPAAQFRVDDKLSGESGQKMGVNLTFKQHGRFQPGRRRPAGAGAATRCSRRASSSPTCSATWTARSPPRSSSRSCSTIRS